MVSSQINVLPRLKLVEVKSNKAKNNIILGII